MENSNPPDRTARGKAVRPLGEDLGRPPIDVEITKLQQSKFSGSWRQRIFRERFVSLFFSFFTTLFPPLRDRKRRYSFARESHFIAKYNPIHSKIIGKGLSDDAFNRLFQHQWPETSSNWRKSSNAPWPKSSGEQELAAQNISFRKANLNSGMTDPGMLNYLLAGNG